MNRTILFFDRCELTHLYGSITPYIEGATVIHVAYSKVESDILSSLNVKADYIYTDLFNEIYDHCKITDRLLETIDEDIISYSDGRFNLNSSIQSDRSFTLLSYEESLHSAVAHYLIWEKIFEDNHVDLMYHEPCSLYLNHIASILCLKQGGVFSYQVQAESDKEGFYYLNAVNDSYAFWELERLYNEYVNYPENIDIERCKSYISSFRKDQSVFFGSILNIRQPKWRLYYKALVSWVKKIINKHHFSKNNSLIDYWLLSQNFAWNKLKNLRGYKKNHIHFLDHIPSGEKYFFYPMHLEPEAVVLYLGDGIYNNQIKLIENVAASLPPGYFLYVKDHPHEYAYRSPEDYARLLKVPNIRLLSQWLPGKELISGCTGLVTINGTAGFEALMMGKQVYCFGKNQYSFHPRVSYVRNIRDFREAVYKNIEIKYQNDESLYPYVMAFLNSLHPGYVNYFLGTAEKVGIDQKENARVIAKDIIRYLDFLKSTTK